MSTSDSGLRDQRFSIKRRLGAGSMGVVYEVWDRKRGEIVALKTLHRQNPSALYNFKKEFRTLADVAHPNLVSLYELIADGDQYMLTMELVDGPSFIEYVRPGRDPEHEDGGTLDEERLRSALRQLVTGVLAVHDAGKLHRDLKPSNVLVTASGRVVILDFGVATDVAPSLHPRTVDNELAGTLVYMAPEQVDGEPGSRASDWYAVGVILFEALTGQLPFSGGLSQVLLNKVKQEAPSAAEVAPGVPADLAELCRDLLVRDPAQRPSGEAVLDRVGGDAGSDLARRPEIRAERLMPVGRRQEMAVLAEAAEASRRGQAVTLYVHGTSGMGKSALIYAFLEELVEESQAMVLDGRCYEREMVPYKAVDGIVDNLSKYLLRLPEHEVKSLLPRDVLALTRLFPVLRRVEAIDHAARGGLENPDPLTLRRRAFAALRELFRRIAEQHHLVLYVDDLQWADADSIALLDDLMRSADAPALLLIASFRGEEIASRPFLRELLQEVGTPGCRELEVGPLAREEAEAFAGSLLRDQDASLDVLVRAIVREAEGSPFLIEQLASYARAADSTLSTVVGLWEMIQARLRGLPAGAEVFLETLALAGRPLATPVVFQAAGLAGDERPLVAALRTAQLVRSSGLTERVEIYHNRLRETLVSHVDTLRARQLHGRLAEALLAHGFDDPEALYEHFLRAGDRQRAAERAVPAAEKASAALAFDRAALFYRRALELGRLDDRRRYELRHALAESLANAGRPGEAAEAFLEAASSAGPGEAIRCRSLAAHEFLAGGYFAEGEALIYEVLDEIGLGVPSGRVAGLLSLLWQRLRLRLRGLDFALRERDRIADEDILRIDTCWAAAASLRTVHPVTAIDLQTRHLRLALDAGDPIRVARALAVEATFAATRGGPGAERAHQLVDSALELAQRVDDPSAIGIATMHGGVTAFMTGRWRRAFELCSEADVIFTDRCTGMLLDLSIARRYLLAGLSYLGEMALLRQRVPVELAEAEERGNVRWTTDLRTRFSVVWLAADDPERVHREVTRALESWQGFHLTHYNGVLGRSQANLYVGDGHEACDRVLKTWPKLRRSGLLRVQALNHEAQFLRGRAALAAAELGDDKNLRWVSRSAARIRRERMAYGQPLAQLLEAGVARLEGDQARARELLGGALEGFESVEMGLHAAAARWRLGELGAGDEGRQAIAAARVWMAEHGIERPERMVAVMAPGFGTP